MTLFGFLSVGCISGEYIFPMLDYFTAFNMWRALMPSQIISIVSNFQDMPHKVWFFVRTALEMTLKGISTAVYLTLPSEILTPCVGQGERYFPRKNACVAWRLLRFALEPFMYKAEIYLTTSNQ